MLLLPLFGLIAVRGSADVTVLIAVLMPLAVLFRISVLGSDEGLTTFQLGRNPLLYSLRFICAYPDWTGRFRPNERSVNANW
jgi:hypothetical protein